MDDGYVDLNARYVEEDEPPTIPDDIPLQEIANEVVRGKRTLSSRRALMMPVTTSVDGRWVATMR